MVNVAPQTDSLETERSLDETDLNIILNRAIKEGGFTVVDFKNCNNEDLDWMGAKLLEKIEAGENVYSIHTQIYDELKRRHEAWKVDFAREETAREAEYAATDKERRFYDKLKQLGEELPGLVRFSTKVGQDFSAPTRNNWGRITVSLKDSEEAALEYVRKNAAEANKIKEALQVEFSGSQSTVHFYVVGHSSDMPEGITPDYVLARGEEIRDTLVAEGGCGTDRFPNLFRDPRISISDNDSISLHNGQLFIEVDIKKGLKENMEMIRTCATDGSPKSIRKGLGATEDTERDRNEDVDNLVWKVASELMPDFENIKKDGIYWIELGERNEAPGMDNWGRMTINPKDTDEVLEGFLRAHIEDRAKVWKEIWAAFKEVEKEATPLGFSLALSPNIYGIKEALTPQEVCAQVRQFMALVQGKFKLPEKPLTVILSDKQSLEENGAAGLELELDFRKTPEDNAAFFISQMSNLPN